MTDLVWMLFWVGIGVVAVIAALHFGKPWLQGRRTQIKESIMAIIGVLIVADWSFLPDGIEGPLVIGASIVGVWLRQVTTTPVGVKDE